MKKLMYIATLILYSLTSFAELSSDDFNAMIQENQKSETELRKKLQKNAGINLHKDNIGKIDRSKLPRPTQVEEVAVSGDNPAWKARKDKTSKELQRANMKRVAEELKQAETN